MRKIKESIECWLLTHDGGVVLLRVRERTGKHPSFLQPITGGIEPGETAEEACAREVREETGIPLSHEDLHRLPQNFDVEIDESLTIRKTLFYVHGSFGEIRINPAEHESWELVDAADVESSLFWQSNKDSWAKIRSICTSLDRVG
jgi:dATP pyrophosphohydrolase